MIESIGERFSTQFSDGRIIANEGPGKGFASYPWVLDEYERALDLSPAESWLLHRMIKHYWKSGGVVFISLAKVCRESRISRPTLMKNIKSLLSKGYIDEVGRKPVGDNRAEYDILGIFFALTFAIQCDPSSNWSDVNGALNFTDYFPDLPEEECSFTTPAEVNRYCHDLGLRFNWCEGKSETWKRNKTTRRYLVDCWDCGNQYEAGSSTAKYCPSCKDQRRKKQWLEFQKEYNQFEEDSDE